MSVQSQHMKGTGDMSRDMVAAIRHTLTEMYKRHEISSGEYAARMEDTRLIERNAR